MNQKRSRDEYINCDGNVLDAIESSHLDEGSESEFESDGASRNDRDDRDDEDGEY